MRVTLTIYSSRLIDSNVDALVHYVVRIRYHNIEYYHKTYQTGSKRFFPSGILATYGVLGVSDVVVTLKGGNHDVIINSVNALFYMT